MSMVFSNKTLSTKWGWLGVELQASCSLLYPLRRNGYHLAKGNFPKSITVSFNWPALPADDGYNT